MQVTIDLAGIGEWLADWPFWAWIITYLVACYGGGGILGWFSKGNAKLTGDDMGFWSASPIIFPIIVILFGGWLLIVVLSFGFIPPPWSERCP